MLRKNYPWQCLGVGFKGQLFRQPFAMGKEGLTCLGDSLGDIFSREEDGVCPWAIIVTRIIASNTWSNKRYTDVQITA